MERAKSPATSRIGATERLTTRSLIMAASFPRQIRATARREGAAGHQPAERLATPTSPHRFTDVLDVPQQHSYSRTLVFAASMRRQVMKALDVMTQPVIAVASDASVLEAARLMLQHKISGLPVLDTQGRLAGMVTEGDFLRRAETRTQRRRPRWLEFLVGPGRLASEYVHASGRRVDDVMTSEVHTVAEDAALDDIVRLMERYRIKRVPVLRGDKLVGI